MEILLIFSGFILAIIIVVMWKIKSKKLRNNVHFYITRDKNGILTWTNEKEKRGGHCMIIRGWTKDGWLVQNSWGRLWGTGGLCVLPYDMKLREVWGVCDNVVGETGNLVVKRANWFKRTFYKVINLFWQIVYCFKKKGEANKDE